MVEGIRSNILKSGGEIIDEGTRAIVKGAGITVSIVNDYLSWYIANEVLFTDEYRFHAPEQSYIMIDVGMNTGITSLLKAKDPLMVHSYAYEPFPETYKRALENFALNPDLAHKITARNFGLSDKQETLTVGYCRQSSGNMTCEPDLQPTIEDYLGSRNKPLESVDVELRSAAEELEPLLHSHREQLVFLKMDCEGAEFRIIGNLAEHGLLRFVDIIWMEYHYKRPDPIVEHLRKFGFVSFVFGIEEVGKLYAVRMGDRPAS